MLAMILMMAAGAPAAFGQSQPERQQPTRQGEAARPASQNEARGQTQSKLGDADQAFVREAAEGGMTEVALGRLALGRASSGEIKQFGQRMVDDHTRSNQELRQIAQGKGVTLPQDPSETHSGAQARREQAGRDQAGQQTEQRVGTQAGRQTGQPGGEPNPAREAVERLSKHSGAEFDREFMRQMVKDHEKAVALFERQAQSGGDADLKGFAAKTLPTLREHAQQAQELAAKVGAPSSDKQ